MSILREIEELISKMSRAEKAQVLQWVVRDLGEAFPGIESTPGLEVNFEPGLIDPRELVKGGQESVARVHGARSETPYEPPLD